MEKSKRLYNRWVDWELATFKAPAEGRFTREQIQNLVPLTRNWLQRQWGMAVLAFEDLSPVPGGLYGTMSYIDSKVEEEAAAATPTAETLYLARLTDLEKAYCRWVSEEVKNLYSEIGSAVSPSDFTNAVRRMERTMIRRWKTGHLPIGEGSLDPANLRMVLECIVAPN